MKKKLLQLTSEYQSLPSPEAKAAYLLGLGVHARLMTDPEKLELAYQAFCGEFAIEGFYKLKEEAIVRAVVALGEKCGVLAESTFTISRAPTGVAREGR